MSKIAHAVLALTLSACGAEQAETTAEEPLPASPTLSIVGKWNCTATGASEAKAYIEYKSDGSLAARIDVDRDRAQSAFTYVGTYSVTGSKLSENIIDAKAVKMEIDGVPAPAEDMPELTRKYRDIMLGPKSTRIVKHTKTSFVTRDPVATTTCNEIEG